MTIRSTPPASSNLALMPVPAPAPIIGTPASMFLRRQPNTCSRVYVGISSSSLLPLRDQLEHHGDRFLGERAVIDVVVHLDDRNPGPHTFLDRVKHGAVGGAILKLLPIAVENRHAAQRNEECDRPRRRVGF